ncbi:glycosyltransferase family 9 protein [Candidatus Kapaibacterium sp.]
MNNFKKKKILIIRLSSIGDVVLTTALLRDILLSNPDIVIDFATYTENVDIVKHNPYLRQIIHFPKGSKKSDLKKFQLSLTNEKYDFIIDLQNNSISKFISQNYIANLSKIDKRRLFKLGLVWLKKGKGQSWHSIHDIYVKAARKFLDLSDSGKGLEFWLESDNLSEKYTPHDKVNYKKVKYNIAIAPGAYYKTKQWEPQYYVELLRKLNDITENIFILGGKSDSNVGSYISENFMNVINYCGELSLAESAEIINKSDLMISNDTGLMHIAASRQVPTIAIFGSTVREFGFEPFRVINRVVEIDLACRPCSHIGRNFCPLGHFRCMKEITPEYVYEETIKLINDDFE